MYAEGITPSQIQHAAKRTGVRVVGLRAHPKGLRFTLKTHGPTTTGQKVQFGRLSRYRKQNGERARIPGAVCWHGFRTFFREAYKLAPEATFKTSLATYTSAENFEASHAATENVPSYRYDSTPCDCPV